MTGEIVPPQGAVGGRLGGRRLMVGSNSNKCWGFAAINGGYSIRQLAFAVTCRRPEIAG